MTAKEVVTGEVIPKDYIEFVRCIDGHLEPYDRRDLLSEKGVFCPRCYTPIKLSENCLQSLRETRLGK